MKRVYWRPNKVSKATVLLVGLLAVGGTALVELLPRSQSSSSNNVRLAAARLAQRSMEAIRAERAARGLPVSKQFDPADTGMIGEAMSAATSLPASLEAKQTSVNPNFAAAVVEMLADAGVRRGDTVAVGCTGSFPAFNLSVCAALETIGARPVIIHSVMSSQFGANHTDLLWLDMESVLHEQGLISFRSATATLGGYGDRAKGVDDSSKSQLLAALERNGVSLMEVGRLAQSIDARMRIYEQYQGNRSIAAYINVGGGAASIHGSQGKEVFGPGLTLDTPAGAKDVDCVATRFSAAGVPVIHLGDAIQLADKFGLPRAPQSLPAAGTGGVFTRRAPSRWLALVVLSVVLITVRVSVWSAGWKRVKHVASQLAGRRAIGHTSGISMPAGVELSV